jgi:glutathione S-transferase
MSEQLTLYYAPQTRATAVRILLEELGAPHVLHVINMRAGEQRKPEYLAINPLGKVPAISHRGALVTELAACFIYLADEFPKAGLAPAIGSPLRGPYLRWLVYYGNCFEPALMDKHAKHEPAPPSQSPYGDYDSMLATISDQLRKGPYLTGDTFTAADILWGTAFAWTTMFKLVPETPEIMTYIERTNARPAFAKIRADDLEMAKRHDAEAAAAG